MMIVKRLSLLMSLVMFLSVSYAWATPPYETTLSYNKESQVLHVEARHPSDRLERHYLRRVVITQNDKQVQELSMPRQVLAWGLSTDINLKAKGEDRIRVDVFCSQGGSGQAELILPPDSKEDIKLPQANGAGV